MAEPFVFERRARRPGAYLMVGLALLFLLVLIFGIGAHPLIAAVFAALIAPAVRDLWRDTTASLRIDDDRLTWKAGSRSGEVALADIAEVQARTALDLSQRAAILTENGEKHRIPMPCLPGGRQLDEALEARGVRVRRSLFIS